MLDFLKHSNPGLQGRFTYFIDFPDYTPEECTKIFTDMVAEQKLKLTADAALVLPSLFSRLRAVPHWSNARDVRTYLGNFTLIAQANRLTETGEQDDRSITRQDLELALDAFVQNKTQRTEPTKEPATLDELVGLASVKETIVEYRDMLELGKRRGEDLRGLLRPNFVMLGNPGTGKTTVAKIMGKIFCDLGYLPTDKLVVVTEKGQLIGQWVGQTALKTRAMIETALGGTLLIDEAYTLGRPAIVHDFGRRSDRHPHGGHGRKRRKSCCHSRGLQARHAGFPEKYQPRVFRTIYKLYRLSGLYT
jgi:hypothetical protein